MLLLPLFVTAQILKPVTKREAEQIGKKTYILSTGDTTRVVNTVGSGLSDPYSKFLFRKNINPEVDSIFLDTKSDYNNLEEAALDVDKLLREIELEKRLNNENNDALAFRLASKLRNLKKKEQTASNTVDSLLKQDPSLAELTAMYLKFGDKPTYYINTVEVPYTLVNQLYPSEIVKREMRATNTASGNPNGEVWLLVTDKALNRIKLPTSITNNYIYKEHTNAPIGEKPNKLVPQSTTNSSSKEIPIKEVIDAPLTGTRVISRTVNNEAVDVNGSTQKEK